MPGSRNEGGEEGDRQGGKPDKSGVAGEGCRSSVPSRFLSSVQNGSSNFHQEAGVFIYP